MVKLYAIFDNKNDSLGRNKRGAFEVNSLTRARELNKEG